MVQGGIAASPASPLLSAHPNVQLHDTPTYSSWLNQVEIWFSKIQRDLIARGIFESKTDLTDKSCATSAITTKQLSPSSGLTKTLTDESDKLFTLSVHCTRLNTDHLLTRLHLLVWSPVNRIVCFF